MLLSFIFLISFGKFLLWSVLGLIVFIIIRVIVSFNEDSSSNSKLQTKSELTDKYGIVSRMSKSTSPFIKKVEKFDDFYSLEFFFPQDIGNIYRLSLNMNFDGYETERSINTAMVMSKSNLGGVELGYFSNSDYYFTLGAYTMEMDSYYEEFILMQAKTKYHKLDVSTRYRILFEDGSYWDFESDYSVGNDFAPKLHRQVFGINKDYSQKLETVPIKNLFIYQENRTTKYTLRKEDQIRIQRMMTMHRLAAQTYFIDKKKLP